MPWLLNIGGKIQGPFDAARIRALAEAGELRPSDLMWRSGMKSWVPAQSVKGVFVRSDGPSQLPPGGGAMSDQSDGEGVEPTTVAVGDEVAWPRTRRAARFGVNSAMWLTLAYTALELFLVSQLIVKSLQAEPGSLRRMFGLLLSNTVGVFYLVGDPLYMALWIWVALQPVAYVVSGGWSHKGFSSQVSASVAPVADSVIRFIGLACWPIYLNKFWVHGIVHVAYGREGLREDPRAFVTGLVLLTLGLVIFVYPGPRIVVRIGRATWSFTIAAGRAASSALGDWVRGEWNRR